MSDITTLLGDYYKHTFAEHGATAKGVDWNDEAELLVRYEKMLAVTQKDFMITKDNVMSILDVGCGWGGLAKHILTTGKTFDYTGIDVVDSMIEAGKEMFPEQTFVCADVFKLDQTKQYDFVVCNAILTQKLGVSIPDMERFTKDLVIKMFELCRHGIAFNMMSTRVNFMVDNLYYQNPVELLSWMLTELSPRVRLDHGYSSLGNGKGRFYDFTVYVYKD
jgi:2-polyprenyl-3-methyl-5-hydroxy-6-metoxy-1,4-benzoquinol methylase